MLVKPSIIMCSFLYWQWGWWQYFILSRVTSFSLYVLHFDFKPLQFELCFSTKCSLFRVLIAVWKLRARWFWLSYIFDIHVTLRRLQLCFSSPVTGVSSLGSYRIFRPQIASSSEFHSLLLLPRRCSCSLQQTSAMLHHSFMQWWHFLACNNAFCSHDKKLCVPFAQLREIVCRAPIPQVTVGIMSPLSCWLQEESYNIEPVSDEAHSEPYWSSNQPDVPWIAYQ